MVTPKLLNVGCGETFHKDWINVDIVASSSEVRSHDIRKGLPFVEESFDACYCSHMLEHLNRQEGYRLIVEMHRVLRSGGTARLVVPDLEAIARMYLFTLDLLLAGHPDRKSEYDWMVLELIDQVARDTSGGEMARALSSGDETTREFILSRIGMEAERFWERRAKPWHERFAARLRAGGVPWFLQMARFSVAKLFVIGIAGREGLECFREGIFRRSGEVHRWMYDRYSLSQLLRKAGFQQINICNANESEIPGFVAYELDTIRGRVRKPDSLYVEATK